jgi:uncharacterized phiE125 gp8 family phage protein
MPWIQLTSPSTTPVSIEEVKNHLRITSSDEDGLIEFYINAATQIVEAKTRRALITRTFRYEQEEFCTEMELPVAPLVSVQTVRYYDTSGVLTTWADTNYFVDTARILGVVKISPTASIPSVQVGSPNAVQINFTAGHGTTADSVPQGLRFVVMLLAGHYFLNRAPVIVGGGSAMEIPATLEYAVDAYKIMSL